MANAFKKNVKFIMNYGRSGRSIVNHGKSTVNYNRRGRSIINHSKTY